MAGRLSSLDTGYTPGMLSVFPEAQDNNDTLYRASNNAETTLKQSITYSGKTLVVQDTSMFPATGLLRVGPPSGQPGSAELIYYGLKTANTFQNLFRGFAGSRQNQWGQGSHVSSGVMAETHNSVKDAVIQIETDLGLAVSPDPLSLNGILVAQEERFLAPKPLFRAYPQEGPSPLQVKFQNFSGGEPIRFLWTFGDGSSSVDKSPIHTYKAEGIYTVTLNMITSTGAQGIITKSNYINVNDSITVPFFYSQPRTGYSVKTAAARTAAGKPTSPTTFLFVDQTDGQVIQRFWIFDDGESTAVDGGNVHTATHQYQAPGTYSPSLLVVFSSQTRKRVFIREEVTVL